MPSRTPPTPGSPLARTERLVLAGIARGRTNPQIARDLHLSVHTVRSCITTTAARLDCPSTRVSVVVEAYRQSVLADLPAEPRPTVDLQQREHDLLEDIAVNLTARQIGRRRYMSEDAVKCALHRMFRRLGAHSREHAIALAVQHGHLTLTLITTTDQAGAAA
ncbi:helix-turn-helix transcriptional regulator [Streptacidiphilus albus]|uniref:helix-turn-helix transcriptional regulator n=1 Tax=Streptacidiphilus albus TaxID=105425 RepID=UPI0006945DC3|nr:helix-turn-helix transcriptional regulator [Streptacidiphilus albus]